MTQEELKILENLKQEIQEKEDNCFNQMTFCRKHKFEMEEAALEYRREAYHRCMLELMKTIDKLKEMKANEHNIFQKGNSSKCVECVWRSVDELPMFDRGENGDMTPFIVDSYYGHIGGVAHFYTRETWKNHIDTHRNREFMWAYESDLMVGGRIIPTKATADFVQSAESKN